MYIPEFNRVEDRKTALDFMRANPFAILVSTLDGKPFATHLPLVIRENGNQVILRGHVAKANPHWKSLEPSESLVIFHGPHAYISPALYELRESVPTWNYAAVHIYGRARIADEQEARRILEELIAEFDPTYGPQWNSLNEDYKARMLRHIVAFEIVVDRLETKFKLSQNRTRTEQANVIRALEENEDSAIAGVAALMKQQGLGLP
jgi:transcriptional regulator